MEKDVLENVLIDRLFYKKKDFSKTDITNNIINIQVKKTKINQSGQIGKYSINAIISDIPELKPIEKYLRQLCELPLIDNFYCDKSYENNRKLNLSFLETEYFINTLNNNKRKILEYVFKGNRNDCIPNLFCISYKGLTDKIIIYRINDIIEYLMDFSFKIKRSKTVISLGNIMSLQRKGGDSGRKSGNKLQFKLICSRLDINNRLEYIV